MNKDLLGETVRDIRTGLVGRVVGVVEWEGDLPPTLVVQPPARPDHTVPPTAYVPTGSAEVVPQAPADWIGIRH
jgi:hypothetical protein